MKANLTTNAVKYGALSVPDGRVRLSWSMSEEEGRSVARLEWQVFEAYRRPDPERSAASGLGPRVNPTLVTLEPGWRLCPWLARSPRAGLPERGDEVALVWRHPETLRSRYHSATPRHLLALKIVLEEIAVERAAAEAGVDVAEVEAVLAGAVASGLLIPGSESRAFPE